MKPMLAINADLEKLRFPYLVSPKIDGVRLLVSNGVAYSRNLKPIRNKHIQSILGNKLYNGLDGELIVGSPTDKDVYRKTNSAVSRIEGCPDFKFHVFDDFCYTSIPFKSRYKSVLERAIDPFIEKVDQHMATTYEDICSLETHYTGQGYEGIMLRCPESLYKFGRSTINENSLLKVKKFTDGEAVVLGFEEQMHNDNPVNLNELGESKRSSHQAGMRPANTLGALVVQDVITQVEFRIGSGFSAEDRKEIWDNWRDYQGKIVSYTYFEVGIKDKPRFPVFKGFRALEVV